MDGTTLPFDKLRANVLSVSISLVETRRGVMPADGTEDKRRRWRHTF